MASQAAPRRLSIALSGQFKSTLHSGKRHLKLGQADIVRRQHTGTRVHVARPQRVVGFRRHDDRVLAVGSDRDKRDPCRQLNDADSISIDAIRAQVGTSFAPLVVVDDTGDEIHCCTTLRGSNRLINPLAARVRT